MKKITLEDHFLSPAYAQHVRDGLPVAAGQKAPFSIAVVVSTVDMPCV